MENYETTLEEYKLDWENFDNIVIKNGWVKTSKTDRYCNTPVYRKGNEEIHLDINFGDITHVQICQIDDLIVNKILKKDEFYKNYCN